MEKTLNKHLADRRSIEVEMTGMPDSGNELARQTPVKNE